MTVNNNFIKGLFFSIFISTSCNLFEGARWTHKIMLSYWPWHCGHSFIIIVSSFSYSTIPWITNCSSYIRRGSVVDSWGWNNKIFNGSIYLNNSCWTLTTLSSTKNLSYLEFIVDLVGLYLKGYHNDVSTLPWK